MERTPSADPVVASELDTLSQRLRSLDARFDEDVATSTEVMQAIDALRAELGSTATPVAMDTAEIERTIGALMARLEGLAEAVATTGRPPGGPAAEELQRLVDERIEAQVAAQVAERVGELTRSSRSASPPPRHRHEPAAPSRATPRASTTCWSATG